MSRREARESAFKIIYAIDMGENTIQDAADIVITKPIDEKQKQFIINLAQGVVDNFKKIDNVINKHSSNWDVCRMASTDRNILRLAVYEMLYCDDIPVSVSINEAVELSKKYCDVDSYKFINGILGSISEEKK